MPEITRRLNGGKIATTPPSEETIEKERIVLNAIKNGKTMKQAAKLAGYANGSSASAAYYRALSRINAPEVTAVRRLQGDRIAAAADALMPKAMKGHTPSVLALVALWKREADLWGLDHEHGVAERLVQLEADKVRIMGMALVATLADLGLTEEQAAGARAALFTKMRELAGVGMPELPAPHPDPEDPDNDQEQTA